MLYRVEPVGAPAASAPPATASLEEAVRVARALKAEGHAVDLVAIDDTGARRVLMTFGVTASTKAWVFNSLSGAGGD